MQLLPPSGQTVICPLRCSRVLKLQQNPGFIHLSAFHWNGYKDFYWLTGSVSGDSMKEKLLTNYGETMKLKADTGHSYCEFSGSGPQNNACFFFLF